MNIGGVSGKVEWNNGDAIAGATIKDGMGATVATTGEDGTFFFWAPAEAMVYTITDADGLLGTMDASATAMENKTLENTVFTKPKKDDGDNGDGDGDFAFNTLAIVLVVVILILIVLMVMMMMKK